MPRNLKTEGSLFLYRLGAHIVWEGTLPEHLKLVSGLCSMSSYTMQLNYKKYGESGPVIVIIHGIFGSLDNWHTVAKELGENTVPVGEFELYRPAFWKYYQIRYANEAQ